MKAHSNRARDPRRDFVLEVSAASELHVMDLRRPLVLVSGGPDSVALLRVLVELGSRPQALHFDHGLRGRESDADADFVLGLCEKLGVACEVQRLDLGGTGGVQEAARDERYRLGRIAAERHGCTCIATGHNADDVAETMLMNLARGGGTRGGAGIPPATGAVMRPLIDSTRADILAYLRALDQNYRTDSSNLKKRYSRNRMRLEVIPALQEMYPGASVNLTRAAGLLREDLGVLEDLASLAVESGEEESVLRVRDLPHPGLLSHAVRVAYSRVAPRTPPPSSSVVRELEALLQKTNGTRSLDLPDRISVVVRFGEEIVFRRRGEKFSESNEVVEEVDLPEEGEISFEGWNLRVRGSDGLDRADSARREVCYLDGGMGLYRVRRVREGDKIRPLGLGGTKSVFRAMMDRKIPRDIRDEMPVVVGISGEIAWLPFGETGEKFAVREGTEAVIRLEISGGRRF